MYHFFVEPEQIGANEITITGSDVNHIRNVLRMEEGEQISVSSGESATQYRCAITSLSEECVVAKIMWAQEADTELPAKLYLFQGLPKGDKMELIIQKAVELGVYEIIPVATKRAVVKLDAKKAESKCRRWNAISESAAKQSKRMIVPEVKNVMTFSQAVSYAKEICTKMMIPYELAEGMEETRRIFADIQAGDAAAVFIGPEGGFDEAEVALARQAGASAVTLGRRILRTETAGMMVLSILMFHLEGQVRP